jgi:hypothetical protein
MKLANISDIIPRVLPFVYSCPKSMVVDALQNIAMDFFKNTEVWQDVLSGDIDQCEQAIDFFPEVSDSVIVRIFSLTIKGGKVSRECFSLEGHNVVRLKYRLPHDAHGCFAHVVLRPGRNATKIPAELIEDWGDVIAAGALAKIKLMTGPKVEWSDPQGAAVQNQLYVEGTARAKIQRMRDDKGGGSLTIFDRRGLLWDSSLL